MADLLVLELFKDSMSEARLIQRGAGERFPCNARSPFGVTVRLPLRRAVSNQLKQPRIADFADLRWLVAPTANQSLIFFPQGGMHESWCWSPGTTRRTDRPAVTAEYAEYAEEGRKQGEKLKAEVSGPQHDGLARFFKR